MIELDLLSKKSLLKTKNEAKQQWIFDPIRKKWLVLQPEELVRQLLIQYLISEKNYPKNRIAVEKLLIINDLERRFDVLVYDTAIQPFMLVECKAPRIGVSDETFRQIAQYNLPLRVQYLLVTNGITTYCCRMNYEQQSYEFLSEVPDASEKSTTIP